MVWMPPDDILHVWRSFDAMCMETITKVWRHRKQQQRPRNVAEMEADFQEYGACGNCFDLSSWLSHRFDEAGIQSYKVSDNILHQDAHVAVIAMDYKGHRYLCDLGDMWLMPICIDFPTIQPVGGFFPAAQIELQSSTHHLSVLYHRPGGQNARQSYDLTPIDDEMWILAAQRNHDYLAQFLVEVRDFQNQSHWEFTPYSSRWSTPLGLRTEAECTSLVEWANRISARTTMCAEFVLTCLEYWAHNMD